MRVLGIDLGVGKSPSALALMDLEGSAVHLRLRLSILAPQQEEWPTRVQGLGVAVLGHVRELRPELVAYEAPHLGFYRRKDAGPEEPAKSNPQTLRQLAALEGAILLACAMVGVPAIAIQPVQAKIALAGDRYAKKRAMIQAARTITGAELPSHEADAVGIAMAGETQWQRGRLLAAAHEEA